MPAHRLTSYPRKPGKAASHARCSCHPHSGSRRRPTAVLVHAPVRVTVARWLLGAASADGLGWLRCVLH